MAFDAFLHIDDIPGESTDSAHDGWIEIKNYEHVVNQPISGSVSSGGGLSSERVNHGAFYITKELDKASPKLHLYCCNGTHIPKIQLQLCRAGGDKQQYMEVTLENSIVESVESAGNSEGDGSLPTETVAFRYGKISWAYTELDHKTGLAKGDIAAEWDQEVNTGA